MRNSAIRILLIEGDDGDARLVLEAIAEIHEGRYRTTYTSALEAIHVETLEEAVLMLQAEHFDAILLDLSLPDSRGLATYFALRSAAVDLPVIVLADAEDESLAASVVREGAQDYLTKTEIDCMPLARSLRYSIERQRLATALRRVSLIDDFTGLYSMNGFFALAEHDLELARRLGTNFSVLMAEADPGEDETLARLAAADRLRDAFPCTAVVGRLAGDRFAVAAAGFSLNDLPRLALACGSADLRSSPEGSLRDLLLLAEQRLCENSAGGNSSRSGKPSVSMQPIA